MVLSTPYNSQSSAIASYNYSDLAENTGIKLFYGASTVNNSGTTFFLTQNQIYSGGNDFEIISTVFNTGSYVKCLDMDLDLTAFNAPTTIKGTATIAFCALGILPTGVSTKEYYEILKLRKISNSVETEIGSSQTASRGFGDAIIECVLINIPITVFKKGDILRLTIEGYGKNNGGSDSGRITIGADPMNRDGSYIIPSTDTPTSTTQLKAWIPFNLDL